MESESALPYLALVRLHSNARDNPQFGTGILIDPCHVLTCFHVVHEFSTRTPQRPTTNEKLRPDNFDKSQRVVVNLGGCGEDLVATIVHEDEHDDLALLRLPVAIAGVQAPIELITPPTGAALDVWVCGFDFRERYRFVVHVRKLDPGLGKQINGRLQSGEHSYGIEGGISGGPIFAEENGLPVFIGMAVLGGLGSPTGHFAASDRIHQFLRENGIVPSRGSDGPVGRWCRVEGYASVVKSRCPDLISDHYCLIEEDAGKPCFYGLRPVAAAIESSRAHLPAAVRLAAHIKSPMEIDPILARLREVSGLSLRLPTEAEFRRACTSAEPQRRVVGRPPILQDYDPDESFRAPPDTSAEWVEDGGRRCLVLFREGSEREFNKFADATSLVREFPLARAAIRTVIDRSLP
ncbi:MAG: trypsin-like peptidase domain-containing protein [Rhodopseudomonas palustris]|uniref:Trypsin-like peptidase domain-containing protein n=1 Tax=Rhodopseudomonas palustris TaxID=1076 RepID=A0A933RZW7_RHOPL|nr:trypsin-like peptidase domain-containing protein [Rhodopseudomonas palustris]